MMRLFEFAVIYNPLQTKEQDERGENPKSILLVPVTAIVAGDEKQALMLAARAIPETHTDKLDLLEIACRPF